MIPGCRRLVNLYPCPLMDQLSELPLPLKVVLATLSGGALVGTAYMIDPRAMWIVLFGLLLVLLVFVGYLCAIHLTRKRQAAAMTGSITQHSSVAPRGISDPAQRARLDGMRQIFQKGVDRFRAAGKDLYSLPWYLVVGEPGAGKTEAIRHCQVGFPPGLQDRLQGTGGTINMHWWFTNHAVLLDTAGRMLFEKVPPGSSSEWREFLKLLRKARPDCPINGLILVIPSDTLMRDSMEEIVEKAGRIAEQFTTIQSQLDVRFPVFVFITKCDLIQGFREFFDDVTNPQLQQQVLGWSNPDPLDHPFRPDLVDQHFESVLHRIRRRRLGLIQDPMPQEAAGRRLDEVDALFSLPASMALLAPRLKRYLQVIFEPTAWSGQPLFLRGIYFASAMREGAALDLELAEAIGVPVDSLPDGRAWERERAYFLRDLFLDKIFKERGLVTRASNTRVMLRRRQLVVFGTGFAALFLLLGLSWFGARSLRSSVGGEREFWIAAKDGWNTGSGRPIVSPEFKESTRYVFNGDQTVRVGEENVRLVELHRRLATLARADLRVPWIFRPLDGLLAGVNPARREAQRVVFETGVVAPLVQAARDKVMRAGDEWSPASSEALAFLVRLEGMIQHRQAGLTSEELSAHGFLHPLGAFVYGADRADPDLSAAFAQIYVEGGSDRSPWPPRWLSAGATLAGNRPIVAGLAAFLRHTEQTQVAQASGIEAVRAIRDALRLLRRAEDELAALAAPPRPNARGFAQAGEEALAAVELRKQDVDHAIAAAIARGVLAPGRLSLGSTYTTLVADSRARTTSAFRLIQAELDAFAVPVDEGGKAPAYTLPTDLRRALSKVQQETTAKAESTFTADELAEMQAFDARFLEDVGGDARYHLRGALYQAASAQLRMNASGSGMIAGEFTPNIARLRDGIGRVRELATGYQGAFQAELTAVIRRTLEFAETTQTQRLFEQYIEGVESQLARQAGFPVVMQGSGAPLTPQTLRALTSLLQRVRVDLTAMKPIAPSALAGRLDALDGRVHRLGVVAEALVSGEDTPATVGVTLLRYDEQLRRLMGHLGSEASRARFAGRIWRVVRFGVQRERTDSAVNTELGRRALSEGSLVFEFFRSGDEPVDRQIELSGPWAPLQLIQQPNVRRLAGGIEWEVMLTINDDEGREHHLVLLLRFDKPLPELDQWLGSERIGGGVPLRPL